MNDHIFEILQEEDNLLFNSLGFRLTEAEVNILRNEKELVRVEQYYLFRYGENIIVLKNSTWGKDEICSLLEQNKIFKVNGDTIALIELDRDKGIIEKRGAIVLSNRRIQIPHSSIKVLMIAKKEKIINITLDNEQKTAIAIWKDGNINLTLI